MNSLELQKLAQRTRTLREASVTILLASGILALFIFIPVGPTQSVSAPITIENSVTPNAFADLPLEAEAAIVYDLATGETLYEKNADAQLPLSSLIKLLTVYAALTTLSPDTLITIPESIASIKEPLFFSIGQTFSLSDLARLTLTASLNDGAVAIASAVTERENRTQTDMLASVAASLSLSQTYAVNSSGLDINASVSGGYGSARDMARLAGAMTAVAPTISAATTQLSAQATSTEGDSFKVLNTSLIVNTIPRLLLSKTGYTDLANGNLAFVFDAGIRHPIAIVVLGSSAQARFTDGTALLAATFAHFADRASL